MGGDGGCQGTPGVAGLSPRAVPGAVPCRAGPELGAAVLGASEGRREGRREGLAAPSESRPRHIPCPSPARDIRPPAAAGAATAAEHGPAQR